LLLMSNGCRQPSLVNRPPSEYVVIDDVERPRQASFIPAEQEVEGAKPEKLS